MRSLVWGGLLLVASLLTLLVVGLLTTKGGQEQPEAKEVKVEVQPQQVQQSQQVQQPQQPQPAMFLVGRLVACPVCGGDGWVTCPECGGTGYIERNTLFGAKNFICPTCQFWRTHDRKGVIPCSFCQGRGVIPMKVQSSTPYSDPRLKVCPDCGGQGVKYNIYSGRYEPCAKCWGSGWTFLDIP